LQRKDFGGQSVMSTQGAAKKDNNHGCRILDNYIKGSKD